MADGRFSKETDYDGKHFENDGFAEDACIDEGYGGETTVPESFVGEAYDDESYDDEEYDDEAYDDEACGDLYMEAGDNSIYDQEDVDTGDGEEFPAYLEGNVHPLVRLTQDQMAAYVMIPKPDEVCGETCRIAEDLIFLALEEAGVIEGISEEGIEQLCSGGVSFGHEVKVAEGTPPVNGRDGHLQFQFRTSLSGKPKEMVNGDIDYKELDLIQNVERGEILCTAVPPSQGEAGMDVCGNRLEPKAGREAVIHAGKNVEKKMDAHSGRIQYLAGTDGCVTYTRGWLDVEKVYNIHGDVGPETGHVDFNGSVRIEGNVLEGFDVFAARDIHVGGRVEGCRIQAGGSVVIENGVAGMEKAQILAGRNLTAKYIESAEVTCGGNLYCDMILQSRVKAGGSVILMGPKTAIIGGDCLAGGFIEVQTLGSERHIIQNISVIEDWMLQESRQEEEESFFLDARGRTMDRESLMKQLQELKKEVGAADRELAKAREKNNLENGADREYRRRLAEKAELENHMKLLRSRIRDAEEENQRRAELSDGQKGISSRILCRGIVYPGVKITINNAVMKVMEELNRCYFIENKGEISVIQNV